MLRFVSTVSGFVIQMGSMRIYLEFPTISREVSLNTRGLHYESYDYEEFPDEIMEADFSELFYKENKNV